MVGCKHAYTLPVFIMIVLVAVSQQTQAQNYPPFKPTRQQVLQAYKSAVVLNSLAWKSVFKNNVRPFWQADSKAFWYKNALADDNQEFIHVNSLTGEKQPAFDHKKLANALSKATDSSLSPTKLPVIDIRFGKNPLAFLKVNSKWFKVNLNTYQATLIDLFAVAYSNNLVTGNIKSRWQRQPASDSASPDKKWLAYIQNGNVFVQPATGGEVIQYTKDGDTINPYGQMQWSPDSKYLVVFHIGPVEEKPVYIILSSVDSSTRGELQSHPYAQPGDPFTSYEMFTISLADKKLIKTSTELYNFLDYPAIHWRTGLNRYFVFEKADRGHQRFRMIEVDAASGSTRNLIDHQTNTFIYENRIFTWYTATTNEVIWTSEKDGWNQLYLVDAVNGGIKNRITNGSWVVRGIDSVDETKREIWFRASGVNITEDPYNIHYYRIGFNGKNLVSLTPEAAYHQLTFSPDRQFYIDNFSRPDLPATTRLRRTSDAKDITLLEQADLTVYNKLGLRMPEVFVAKARDGVTDIWGLVCRPRMFDSTKKYPVIENIYAGPQDSYTPKTFMNFSEMQSMAELGFIVVELDALGTANRSKAFHDVAWKNLGDAGLPDRILWIKALAEKYPYIDTTRVGLYGTSAGGQNSTGALLFHPQFYKAAVSAAGCHDNRIDKQWWNEQWMGYPVGAHYNDQSNITNAAKLKGHLLLIVGEADDNVPPESTLRLAGALIKAGKTFDFLEVPGMKHSDGGPYGRQKKRDFFVKNLLGVDPPDRNNDEVKN